MPAAAEPDQPAQKRQKTEHEEEAMDACCADLQAAATAQHTTTHDQAAHSKQTVLDGVLGFVAKHNQSELPDTVLSRCSSFIEQLLLLGAIPTPIMLVDAGLGGCAPCCEVLEQALLKADTAELSWRDALQTAVQQDSLRHVYALLKAVPGGQQQRVYAMTLNAVYGRHHQHVGCTPAAQLLRQLHGLGADLNLAIGANSPGDGGTTTWSLLSALINSRCSVCLKWLLSEFRQHLDLETRILSRDCSRTALHIAFWSGNTEAAKMLLDSGALVTALETPAASVLHIAAHYSDSGVLSLLLERLKPSMKDLKSLMELGCTMLYNSTPLVVAALRMGGTLESSVVTAGPVDCFSLLLSAAAEADLLPDAVTQANRYGQSVLQVLIGGRLTSALQQVLQACAAAGKLNAVLQIKDESGRDAVLAMRRIGHAETLTLALLSDYSQQVSHHVSYCLVTACSSMLLSTHSAQLAERIRIRVLSWYQELVFAAAVPVMLQLMTCAHLSHVVVNVALHGCSWLSLYLPRRSAAPAYTVLSKLNIWAV